MAGRRCFIRMGKVPAMGPGLHSSARSSHCGSASPSCRHPPACSAVPVLASRMTCRLVSVDRFCASDLVARCRSVIFRSACRALVASRCAAASTSPTRTLTPLSDTPARSTQRLTCVAPLKSSTNSTPRLPNDGLRRSCSLWLSVAVKPQG